VICVTGAERHVDRLARRLDLHRRFPLQEVRLDLLDRIDDDIFPLLSRPDLVVTCRGEPEGGGYRGSHTDRFQILSRALDRSPGYLDVEVSFPAELRRRLYQRCGSTRLILSWHGTTKLTPGTRWPRELSSGPSDLLKIAAPVHDAADLAHLLRLKSGAPVPVLRIGIGPAGVISRALYTRFDSPWTFVVPDGAEPVAPGQLTVTEAERWRIDQEAALTPIGLIGGAPVLTSPGPRVYNYLFAKHGLPQIYLPVVTERPVEALALLERLGFSGCSVTMPAKEVLAGQVTRLEPPADRLAAVNTIRLDLEIGSRVGLNTDVAAVQELLEAHGGEPALVLGAGGAASAVVAALAELGCPTTVTSRDPARAESLARSLGCSFIPWESRGEHGFRVLVNATPCGADGLSDPVPEEVTWRERVVLDAVIAREPTPLLRRVTAGGGIAIDGNAWWIRQGRLQMEALAGRRFDLDEMQEALDATAR
jgi:3-dehydroquinate dehydratase type I